MHSIERYGIVALLFLVVTVIAVLMWDGNRGKEAEGAGNDALAAARPVEPGLRPDASHADPDAERRLSLVADSRPGPLQREPNGVVSDGAPASAAVDGPAALSAASEDEVEPDLNLVEDGLVEDGVIEPGSAPEAQRERPAPEQVIGKLDAAPPAAATTHAYAVRAGDTLSEIAQRELGSSRRWQELVAVNPGLDPAKLHVGKTIRIPGAKAAGAGSAPSESKTALASAKPKEASAKSKVADATGKSSVAGATWKVGKGENLWRIAERALGDGKRWKEIAKLNPKVNPDKLALGQVLTLPGSAKPASNGSKGDAPKSPQNGAKTASASPASSKAAPKSAKKEPVLVASASERGARRGGKVK